MSSTRCILGFAVVLALALGACDRSDPLAEAIALQDRGDFEASLAPLRVLLDERPDDPEIQFRYGAALGQMGNYSLAQWALMRAMEDPDWAPAATFGIAELSIQNSNWNQAIEMADRFLASRPDDVAALKLRTRALLGQRTDYDEALKTADRVLELEPENLEILPLRFVALMGTEEYDAGEEALQALVERLREAGVDREQSAYFCAALGLFAVENKEPEVAEQRYEQCLEDFPENDTVVRMTIEFFDSIDRKDRSIEILQEVLERTPHASYYRNLLATHLEETGKRDEAVALLQEATAVIHPGLAAAAWLNLGMFHIETQNYDEAADAGMQALKLTPNASAQIVAFAADGLLLAKRYDEALRLAETMTVPVHQVLVRGRVALGQGRTGEAMEHFEKGLTLWPDNAIARYYTARTAEQLGDFDRAISEYRYTLRADPTATDAKPRLARILFAQGNDPAVVDTVEHALTAPSAYEDEALLIAAEALARNKGRLRQALNLISSMASEDPEKSKYGTIAIMRGLSALETPGAGVAFMDNFKWFEITEPENADLLGESVILYAKAGQPEKGLIRAEEARKKHPEEPSLQAIYGLALEHTGANEQEVRSVYEQALALDPESEIALYGLARLDARAGNFAQALARLELSSQAPEEIALDKALWLEQSGRPDEASQLLVEHLVEFPTDAPAALQLTKLHLRDAGDLNAAKRYAEQAERFAQSPQVQDAARDLKHTASQEATAPSP